MESLTCKLVGQQPSHILASYLDIQVLRGPDTHLWVGNLKREEWDTRHWKVESLPPQGAEGSHRELGILVEGGSHLGLVGSPEERGSEKRAKSEKKEDKK